jgi:Ser/Thr protein kinase RdoA (MazF antagonist)
MFLYESVPGIPLMVLLRRRQPGRFLWLEKSAAWLARLHQEKVPAGRPRTRARESQEAGYFLMNYRGFSPSCVPRAKELLRLFFAYRARLVPSRSSVLLHGDYNPNNVIVDRGRRSLSVIDFGNACRYDPMFDLANALVQLEYVTLRSRKEVENLTHRFFASYARFKSLTPIDERRLALFRIWWALQTLSFTMTLPMTTKKNVVPVIARTFRIADQSLRILSASP